MFTPGQTIEFPEGTVVDEIKVVVEPEDPTSPVQIQFELTACYHPGMCCILEVVSLMCQPLT